MHPLEELRFINNLSILMECGRPLLPSLRHLRDCCTDRDCLPAFDAMIQVTERGGDFTEALLEHPELCSRTSLALLRAGRRSSCLDVLLPKVASLIRSKVEGEWDPRRRFFETWALMTESGIPVEESLTELRHDFGKGPLAEVAEGLRTAVASGKKLYEGARRFPEVFDAVSIDLLQYGEARNLAKALRGITQLI